MQALTLDFTTRSTQSILQPKLLECVLRSSSVPTLQDVATEAKVSTATVSRALNNPESVVQQTRERVLDAVARLGYSPNFGARALAARRTNTIGAVIPTMENAIFARGLQSFQETLSKGGCTLLVASSSYRSDLEEEQVRALVARGADGLLLIGKQRRSSVYEFLNTRSIPYVVAWTFQHDSDHTYVGFDNRAAAGAMLQRVLSYGHRAIGMIAGLTTDNDRARDRLSGVRDVINRHSHEDVSLTVVEAAYSYEEGGKAAELLLSHSAGVRPTVLVCGNDILAVGAIMQARKMGFRVPRDVSVTGFDDIEVATVIDPPLTTVHVPHRDMGGLAAQSLLQMLRGGKPSASHELTPTIVERESLTQAS